jgi:hypothetical protein
VIPNPDNPLGIFVPDSEREGAAQLGCTLNAPLKVRSKDQLGIRFSALNRRRVLFRAGGSAPDLPFGRLTHDMHREGTQRRQHGLQRLPQLAAVVDPYVTGKPKRRLRRAHQGDRGPGPSRGDPELHSISRFKLDVPSPTL